MRGVADALTVPDVTKLLAEHLFACQILGPTAADLENKPSEEAEIRIFPIGKADRVEPASKPHLI